MEQHENREGNAQQSKFIDRFDVVVLGLFSFAERGLLLLIGALAIVAVGFELGDLLVNRDINLADLLLLFIYLRCLAWPTPTTRPTVCPLPYRVDCNYRHHTTDSTEQRLRA